MNLFFNWHENSSGDGILIGADITQEWLLPWWWKKYSEDNSYPVAFIDFGMSFEKKNWCKERGELIPLRLFDDFIKTKEEIDPDLVMHLEDEFGKQFWQSRSVWFKKPFAFLQTPFQRTIWIDLDCEIRGNLKHLFDFADPLGMIIDSCDKLVDYSYPIYNSGVVPYLHSTPLILDWAKECVKKNGLFRGDQEVLSHLIQEKKPPFAILPPEYNWSRTQEENPDALIVHWHGVYGKLVIRNQITVEELFF